MAIDYATLERARVLLGRAGISGTGITEAQLADILARLTAEEGKRIEATPGVNVTSPVAGQALVYNASGDLVNAVPSAGSIDRVTDSALPPYNVDDVAQITIGAGLKLNQAYTTPRAHIEANVGTGAGQLAAGDHQHTTPLVVKDVFGTDPTTLTSGTRWLKSQDIGLTTLIPTTVEVEGHLYGQGVNDLVRVHLLIDINGTIVSTSTLNATEPFTFEWGVNAKYDWDHTLIVTRGATDPATITVRFGVQWVSAGELQILGGWIKSRRSAAK